MEAVSKNTNTVIITVSSLLSFTLCSPSPARKEICSHWISCSCSGLGIEEESFQRLFRELNEPRSSRSSCQSLVYRISCCVSLASYVSTYYFNVKHTWINVSLYPCHTNHMLQAVAMKRKNFIACTVLMHFMFL